MKPTPNPKYDFRNSRACKKVQGSTWPGDELRTICNFGGAHGVSDKCYKAVGMDLPPKGKKDDKGNSCGLPVEESDAASLDPPSLPLAYL